MLNETEKERLRMKVLEKLKDDADLFDTEAEIDSSLTYTENLNILNQKIDRFLSKEINRDMITEQEKLDRLNKIQKDNGNFWQDITQNIKVLICLGDSGSGKTAFMFKTLQQFQKPVYIYQHPKPAIITALGYKNLKSVAELSRLTDAVVFIDEPQLYFRKYDKKTNEMFILLCSLARQNELTLLFSTSDTRWVNKGLESYVSHWVIKDLDMTLIKQGSAAKRIISAVMPLAINELNLNNNEYIFYSKKDNLHNGLHTFTKPIYFDDRLSKAYKFSRNNTEIIYDIKHNCK